MDTKKAKRLLANAKTKKRVGKQILARGNSHRYTTKNDKEDAIIEAIDQRRVLMKYSDYVEKLRTQKMTVPEFIQSVAPDVAIQILHLALEGDTEKTRLAAAQDVLDRAGYGKIQKHALATVDAGQSKEALISLIMGAGLVAENVELEDDTEDQD